MSFQSVIDCVSMCIHANSVCPNSSKVLKISVTSLIIFKIDLRYRVLPFIVFIYHKQLSEHNS